MSQYDLLNVENAKTIKGEELGWKTGVLYLAPAKEAGIVVNGKVISLCVNSSKGCEEVCLYRKGRASFDPAIIAARIRRTQELFADREQFLNRLRRDIKALIRAAQREGLKPCVRINGTSDLFWLVKPLLKEFPNIQFYDYTKHSAPWLRERSNYHLTFSLSEDNWQDAQECLARGWNVAVPFDTKRRRDLPATWRGYQVIDGDMHDVRFLDGHQGVIIGLRAKGQGEKRIDHHGFVQIAQPAIA